MSVSEDLVLFRRAPASLRRAPLREFARKLRDEVAGGHKFHCLITDDRELRRLNREFLGRDYATDVLSFPGNCTAASPGGKPAIEPAFLAAYSTEQKPARKRACRQEWRRYMPGELAISAERAAEQAREFGHTQLDEIRILMLHGVLHLLGMDHERDRGKMARAEARWRKKLNLPSGLIARAS